MSTMASSSSLEQKPRTSADAMNTLSPSTKAFGSGDSNLTWFLTGMRVWSKLYNVFHDTGIYCSKRTHFWNLISQLWRVREMTKLCLISAVFTNMKKFQRRSKTRSDVASISSWADCSSCRGTTHCPGESLGKIAASVAAISEVSLLVIGTSCTTFFVVNCIAIFCKLHQKVSNVEGWSAITYSASRDPATPV